MSFTNGPTNYASTRVLVIEDEGHVRRIVCRLLRQMGFQLVDEAANGEEGLMQVVRVKPELIICDIHMEPVDGLEFLRKLRGLNNSEMSNLPVIYLTADANRDTVLVARELKVSGYLVKPVSLDHLKSRVDAALRG
ncbi:MAG: response regulator [Alphaproteobacteria bacterium]